MSRISLPRLQMKSSAASGIEMKYMVGTMIEIPRAALLADEIAEEAEFFSFGTNDLTQMTFGFSRDDAGGFLSHYYDKKILRAGPIRPSGSAGRRQAGRNGGRAGPQDPPEHQAGHLRRTWRRSKLDRILSPRWTELCFLQSVPCSDRPLGRSAGSD